MPGLVQQKLRVTRLLDVHTTARGNTYLECGTDVGMVAFWGDEGDRRNIQLLQEARLPATVTCGCIASNWSQHRLWVPQHSCITVLEGTSD